MIIMYEPTVPPPPPTSVTRRWVAQLSPIQTIVVSPAVITSNGGGSSASVNVNEGTTSVTTVAASGTAPIAYVIVGGADQALFELNVSTGVLVLLVPGVLGSYEVIVQASNDYGLDQQILTANVIAQLGWFPLMLTDIQSADGENADCAMLASGAIVQLTAFWSDGPVYEDQIFINSNTDGTLQNHGLAQNVLLVSNNHAFDGANGGLCARMGQDGFLYVTTISTALFNDLNYGLSKINISTLIETAFMTPSVINEHDDSSEAQMATFTIGSTQYVAIAQSGVGDPAYVEIINATTMVSVGSIAYADGNANLAGFVAGRAPNGTSQELLIVHFPNLDLTHSIQIDSVIFSTMTGLSTSMLCRLAPSQFNPAWTNTGPNVACVSYDPVDQNLIMFVQDSGPQSTLAKVDPDLGTVIWTIPHPVQNVNLDGYTVPTPSDLANSRLFYPVFKNPATGDYKFVNTATGAAVNGSSLAHLVDMFGITPIWMSQANQLIYFDRGTGDFIPGVWDRGWAVFSVPWAGP